MGLPPPKDPSMGPPGPLKGPGPPKGGPPGPPNPGPPGGPPNGPPKGGPPGPLSGPGPPNPALFSTSVLLFLSSPSGMAALPSSKGPPGPIGGGPSKITPSLENERNLSLKMPLISSHDLRRISSSKTFLTRSWTSGGTVEHSGFCCAPSKKQSVWPFAIKRLCMKTLPTGGSLPKARSRDLWSGPQLDCTKMSALLFWKTHLPEKGASTMMSNSRLRPFVVRVSQICAIVTKSIRMSPSDVQSTTLPSGVP